MNKMMMALMCLTLCACDAPKTVVTEPAQVEVVTPKSPDAHKLNVQVEIKPATKFQVDDKLKLTIPDGPTYDVVVVEVTQVQEFETDRLGNKKLSQGYIVVIFVERKAENGSVFVPVLVEVPEFALSEK